MSKLLNYCPHDLNIHLPDGSVTTIPSSGELRAATRPYMMGGFTHDIPYKVYSGHCIDDLDALNKIGLQDGDGIVVSQVYAMAMLKEEWKFRFPGVNVFWPDSNPGSVVRNEKGMIVGVKGLIMWDTV